ncbi:CDP-alcohol phosphatidyltransferase family protein [Dictyobacter aurantiacus]|uniref:CDP-alcohol phosphatidyltransferase n=1 Tax=Dictyobacter aurantiacus TaxID=1936993 RepID=A0A401Z8S2_9CHLR|nr:CDP-alcohol phosphatidyltransferase family protein [Dictyobacter aurantiacus]GCE03261.1 hypothetical protein KDAU_05900 [Dictyobacter aurantiacus]
MQKGTEQTFVVELLTTLRNGRFSPRAWGRFFLHSWLMACQTAREHPSLRCSWLRVTCLIGALSLLILLANTLLLGIADTMYLLPVFAICLAWQQCDLFWHLGLNRSVSDGQLLPHVGIANTLTWLRGLGTCYLLGRLVGGLTIFPALTLVIFLSGIATDMLDGYLARHLRTQSRLGQIADGEADFCLYLTLTIIFLRDGMLPLWIGAIMLLRFLLPLLAALVSYLALAHPVRFGSTWWGRAAGLAQCLYFLYLLLPASLAIHIHFLATPLLYIAICLLMASPIAQLIENIRPPASS